MTVPGRVQWHLTHFRPCRHLMTATHYRIRFTVWDQATGITALPTTA
ncbi:hypothetical protein ACFYZN_29655 [Streptomyces sp. NPDC001777]